MLFDSVRLYSTRRNHNSKTTIASYKLQFDSQLVWIQFWKKRNVYWRPARSVSKTLMKIGFHFRDFIVRCWRQTHWPQFYVFRTSNDPRKFWAVKWNDLHMHICSFNRKSQLQFSNFWREGGKGKIQRQTAPRTFTSFHKNFYSAKIQRN